MFGAYRADAMSMVRRVVLVKHAVPVLEPDIPAREWRLGEEGENQARALARRLEPFMPVGLVTSSEPKAVRTAEIVAAALGISLRIIDELEEFDRPALPIVSRADHERLNAQIFADLSHVVLGSESGAGARGRFQSAVTRAIETADRETLVIISHGTVISLLVAAHNDDVDAFEFWKGLECGEFVVLEMPGFLKVRSLTLEG